MTDPNNPTGASGGDHIEMLDLGLERVSDSVSGGSNLIEEMGQEIIRLREALDKGGIPVPAPVPVSGDDSDVLAQLQALREAVEKHCEALEDGCIKFDEVVAEGRRILEDRPDSAGASGDPGDPGDPSSGDPSSGDPGSTSS